MYTSSTISGETLSRSATICRIRGWSPKFLRKFSAAPSVSRATSRTLSNARFKSFIFACIFSFFSNLRLALSCLDVISVSEAFSAMPSAFILALVTVLVSLAFFSIISISLTFFCLSSSTTCLATATRRFSSKSSNLPAAKPLTRE